MIQNKKRVTLNRRSSSLLLDYQAMLPTSTTNTNSTGTMANEYTRQLVESALSLPSSVKISTTPVNLTISKLTEAVVQQQQQQQKSDKHIELPIRQQSSLLKSSLRTPKAASAPCSPTTGLKSVHFNKNNLEDICLFRKAQTPLAISQKNIFWGEDSDDSSSSSSSDYSSSEDEDAEPIKTLNYANWPTRLSDIIDKKTKVIRIEKNTIKLIDDQIVGKVLVRNIDYHKTVTIRYTFDFWETIDNIKAKYHQQDEGHKNNSNNNGANNSYDVFSFKIKLPPNATTMYFAVHYKVGEKDYWDNNEGRNYEIQIKTTTNNKKKKTKKNKQLPQQEDNVINQDHTKEDGLKARYDFSQSINQAKNNINNNITLLSSPIVIDNNKRSKSTGVISSTSSTTTSPLLKPTTTTTSIPTNNIPSSSSLSNNNNSSIVMPIPITPTTRRRSSSSPTGLSCHSPLTSSPSFMDLNSQSYMELVNKYCFYSTSPSSRSPVY